MLSRTMSIKSLVLAAIGAAFLIAAGYAGWQRSRFIATSTVADGRVSALNAGGSHPQIDFVTTGGEKISYPQGGLIFGMHVGDAVRVRYDPAAARATAVVDQFGALWAVPLVLTFFAACLLIGAVQNRSTNVLMPGRYG